MNEEIELAALLNIRQAMIYTKASERTVQRWFQKAQEDNPTVITLRKDDRGFPQQWIQAAYFFEHHPVYLTEEIKNREITLNRLAEELKQHQYSLRQKDDGLSIARTELVQYREACQQQHLNIQELTHELQELRLGKEEWQKAVISHERCKKELTQKRSQLQKERLILGSLIVALSIGVYVLARRLWQR